MGLQCLETGLLQLNSESILLYGAVGVKSACSYQIQSICCDKPRLFHFRAQLQNCTNFNHCKSHMNQNESWIKHPQSAHWQWILGSNDFFHPWKIKYLATSQTTKKQICQQKTFWKRLVFPLWKKKDTKPKSKQTSPTGCAEKEHGCHVMLVAIQAPWPCPRKHHESFHGFRCSHYLAVAFLAPFLARFLVFVLFGLFPSVLWLFQTFSPFLFLSGRFTKFRLNCFFQNLKLLGKCL